MGRKKLEELTILDNFMFSAAMITDTENCRRVLECALVMAIDKVEQVGKSSVGVGYANESCIDVLLGHKIIAYEHSRCISGVYKMGIFRVCQKSEASLLSFFDFREIVDNDISVAFNRSFHKFSQLACG